MVAVGGKKGKNSWTSFVMKIKKEENLPSLKEAMKRASQRKSEWKRGGASDDVVEELESVEESEGPVEVMEEDEYVGGRRRSRSARRARTARRSRARGRARSARRGRARSQKRA
jgi:hypothetical protein